MQLFATVPNISYGTLNFAPITDENGKTLQETRPSICDITNTATTHELQNGDYIVIYKQNEHDNDLVRARETAMQAHEDNVRFAAWKKEQKRNILNRSTKLGTIASLALELDKDMFFHQSGFFKKLPIDPKPLIPHDVTHHINKRVQTILCKGLGLRQPFDMDQAEEFADNGDEILYSGFVDMDDKRYTRTVHTEDDKTRIQFRGLQKGFEPEMWAEIVHNRHLIMVMRPTAGIA